MSATRLTLADLPAELLFEILSFFVPEDTRTLRYVIIACHNTDHQPLHTAAEKILQSQRAWLLDRWYKIHAKTKVIPQAPPDIESIAERIIGKQYVEATEVVDPSDYWVSDDSAKRGPTCSFATLKNAFNCFWKAFKASDLNNAKIRFCEHLGCDPATCTRMPENITYSYDDDPARQRGINYHSRRRDSLNPTRLNVEVSLFPKPSLPTGGDTWKAIESMFRNYRQTLFDGICTGVHWG